MIPGENGRKHYLADLSLLGVTLIWGLSFTILKTILGNEFSPIIFILLRFSLASILVLPFCVGKIGKLDRDGVIGGIVLGAILFSGFATQSIGIQYTAASKSAFITGLSSLFVPFFLFFHKRRFPTMVNGAALAFAIFGMYFLTDPAGGGFTRGDTLTVICAVFFGAHIYVTGIVSPGRDFLSITFIQLLTTSVLAAGFAFFENVKFQLTPGSISAVFYMAILATAFSLATQTWAQQRTSAVKAGIIFTSEPVFAYMFASILLGDYLNPLQKLGGMVIVLAVIASEIIPAISERRQSNGAG